MSLSNCAVLHLSSERKKVIYDLMWIIGGVPPFGYGNDRSCEWEIVALQKALVALRMKAIDQNLILCICKDGTLFTLHVTDLCNVFCLKRTVFYPA